MKAFRLNNKGMTTIEILVSFILVAILSATMYTTVSNYNTKRKIESDKLEINTYKNLLTKQIQDDLIKIGLVGATKLELTDGNVDYFAADLLLADNSKRRIIITRQLADDYLVVLESGQTVNDLRKCNDEFGVYYGEIKRDPSDDVYDLNNNTIKRTDKLESIPLPDLGYGMNHSGLSGINQYKVMDFRIQNVRISTDNNTFSLFLGFYHIDEGSKYAINIVCPINYSS